jgi:plastocyanin
VCGVSAEAAALEGFVTDKSGAPVSDAVFYAEAEAAGAAAKPARTAIVDQINKEFVPFVSVVQTGTSIAFPNKDNIRHHVYSFSPAKKFELKLYSGVPAAPVLFDKPGVVLLGCNIHDWMVAYLLMVDTPFFAKTSNGRARIDGLPAGDYQVKVWHPQLQGPAVAMRVRLEQNRDNTVKFMLDLKAKAQTEQAPAGR